MPVEILATCLIFGLLALTNKCPYSFGLVLVISLARHAPCLRRLQPAPAVNGLPRCVLVFVGR